MAEKEAKIATVIIKVDLECSCCSKKIKRALCKVEKRFKINSIVFDEKKTTVTVSGPFNPDCFIKKICCLAYKVIKDIEIKKPDPPPKESSKPKEPSKPAPPQEVKVSIKTCCSCGSVSSAQQCPKPCPLPCPSPCSKPCPPPCKPPPCPEPCPPPCSKPCPPPCPKPCPPPCSKPCPEPPCPKLCSEPCPQLCPLPGCQPWNQPCPKLCSEPCPQLCPPPFCQPWNQPCSQSSQFGGYPYYKIVCEDEPSYGCSIM